MADSETGKATVDWWTFTAAVLTVAGLSIPLVVGHEQAGAMVRQAYDAITTRFGVLYLWYGIAALGFLLYLAFSRFGGIRLGAADSRPAYSTLSWIAMLFCAGIGAGLLYWAVIEWGYYIQAPPFGLEPRSPEAIEWASSYGLFHWGISAWSF